MRDEHRSYASGGGAGVANNNQNKNKVYEICRRYNKGKCPNGAVCKYLHKCEECGKFGHEAHICHKRKSATPTANTTVVTQEVKK